MQRTIPTATKNLPLTPKRVKGARKRKLKPMPLTAFRRQHHAANNSKEEASPRPSQGGDVLTGSRGVVIYNHVDIFLY